MPEPGLDPEMLLATIFVVDDDEAMRESLEFLLPSFGLDVQTFDSAEAFLDAYDPARPGCLLTDVRMSGMGGLDLHDELRRRDHGIPVVLMTAFSDVPTAVRAMRYGAIDFIEKPFDDQVLHACLLRALEKDRHQRSGIPQRKKETQPTPYPPEQVAHYRIVRKLGEGGMSEVFLAEDTELQRQVALKFLLLRSESTADRMRFRQEARAIAALNHPNIVTVFQILEHGDRLCIAMEYVEGHTLRELIGSREIGVETALSVATQVAAGLAEAHQIGLIHRDVKPENIIVDARGRAKLLDFGIAHNARSPRVTGNGQMIGTPAYMAPEQALGDDADPRSDLFALGVVLYEMLVGRYPFEGDNPMRLLRAILHDPPRPIPEDREDLGGGLRAVLHKALDKDPEARYPDAETLRDDLAALRETPTPHPTPHSTPTPALESSTPRTSSQEVPPTASLSATSLAKTRPGTARIRRPVLLVIVLLVLAVGALSLRLVSTQDTMPWPTIDSSTTIAVLPFNIRGAEDLAYLDHGLVELLSLKLDGAGTLRSVDPRALLSYYERKENPTPTQDDGPEIARRFGARYFTRGSLLAVGSQVNLEVALYDTEIPGEPRARAEARGSSQEILGLLDQVAAQILGNVAAGPSLRLRQAAVATSASLTAVKAFLRGEAHFRDGLYEEALADLQEAVKEDPEFALAHYRLCAVADWVARSEISARAAREAERLSDRLSDHDRRLLEALIAWRRGAAPQAERIYRAILGTYEDDVEAWFRLGEVLFHYGPRQGRSLDEAREAFERAVALEPEHVPALWHLARIAARRGHNERVAELAEQIRRLQPEGDRLLEINALEACVLGNAAERARVLENLGQTRDLTLLITLWDISTFTAGGAEGSFDDALEVAALVTAPSRSPEMRIWGHIARAHLYLASGQMGAAFDAIDDAGKLDPWVATEFRALFLLHPLLEPEPRQLAKARDQLLQRIPEEREDNATPNVFLSVHNGTHDLLRAYLIGRLSLRLGDTDEADRRAEELAAGRPETEDRPEVGALALDLALGLRARIALGRGEKELALGWLRQIQKTEVWYGWTTVSPFFSRSAERYLLAQTLADTGQHDEALRLFGSFAEHSLYDLAYTAPSQLARAELYEAKGQAEQAAHHARLFLSLWHAADAQQAPWRDRASETLGALEESGL